MSICCYNVCVPIGGKLDISFHIKEIRNPTVRGEHGITRRISTLGYAGIWGGYRVDDRRFDKIVLVFWAQKASTDREITKARSASQANRAGPYTTSSFEPQLLSQLLLGLLLRGRKQSHNLYVLRDHFFF